MAKPPPGKCIHCLRELTAHDARNWDHVFPKGWYPDTTPPGIEKWKVRSCQKCNYEYGKIEEDLLIRIGLCLPSEDEETQSISNKARRAIDPEAGGSKRDRRARKALRKLIRHELIKADNVPEESIYPGLGKSAHFPSEREARDCLSRGITLFDLRKRSGVGLPILRATSTSRLRIGSMYTYCTMFPPWRSSRWQGTSEPCTSEDVGSRLFALLCPRMTGSVCLP